MPARPSPRVPLATWCGAAILVLWHAVAWAAFPSPHGRVNDFAGVLDESTRAALQGVIDDAERTSSAEIAVVTVTSLDGMDVERYAEGLFRTWGVGKKGVDNGVLVLVCPGERKMRIEVGYGLEGVLPDGLAGSIIRNQFTPAFKEGDYSRGVLDGVRRVADIVRANHVLTPEELRKLEEDGQGRPPSWLITPFFALFITLGATALGAGLRTRSVFALIWGGLFGGIPMMMSLIPFFNAALWILIPLATGLVVLGYVKGPDWEKRLSSVGGGGSDSASDGGSKRHGKSRGSGHSSSHSPGRSSSSSTWGSSSSSSSSSGSSFGGGRSGGGGASGSW